MHREPLVGRRPIGCAALLVGGLVLPACLAHQAPVASTPPSGPAGPATQVGAASLAASAPEPEANYGLVDFPVSCSAPAQRQFNQALGALHSFFYPETVKAFTRVTALDPTCAMAYWGIALSQLPNPLVQPFPPGAYQRGRDAVAAGKALGAPSERERQWLEAVEAFFGGPDDTPYQARALRYQAAMASLVERLPDDLEASVFHALALLQVADPHDLAFTRQFQAARVLERLVAAHPRHPGIAHYLVHAYDYSPIASHGLAADDTYAALAPSAPHALHMPSHTYSMLGLWRKAIAADQAALAVARAYAARNFPGASLVGEPHSLDFMENAHLQLGQEQEARRVAETAAAIVKTNIPSITVDCALAAVPVRFALERGAWREAADLTPRTGGFAYAEAIGRFGRAVGAARLGDAGSAARARGDVDRLAELQANLAGAPAQAYWAEQAEILLEGASAWLAHAERDDLRAVELLRRAADLEDRSLKHVAMENRLSPMREGLGELLEELQRPAEALLEYQAALVSTPNRLRALRGAARVAEATGHAGEARDYAERLRVLTADANRVPGSLAAGR
jgi:hypothetical protein